MVIINMNKTGNKLYVHRTKHNVEMSTPLCKTTFMTHSKQTIWMAAWVSTFHNVFFIVQPYKPSFLKVKKKCSPPKKKKMKITIQHTLHVLFFDSI